MQELFEFLTKHGAFATDFVWLWNSGYINNFSRLLSFILWLNGRHLKEWSPIFCKVGIFHIRGVRSIQKTWSAILPIFPSLPANYKLRGVFNRVCANSIKNQIPLVSYGTCCVMSISIKSLKIFVEHCM
jgi:hypothetical protein